MRNIAYVPVLSLERQAKVSRSDLTIKRKLLWRGTSLKVRAYKLVAGESVRFFRDNFPQNHAQLSVDIHFV